LSIFLLISEEIPMTKRVAQLPTPHASRYLQQMCKHFGHKVPVDFNRGQGRIELPFGICRLEAGPAALTMRIEAEALNIARLEQVIGSHITRFAFREDPTIAWQSAT
jgi:hypothetical protein